MQPIFVNLYSFRFFYFWIAKLYRRTYFSLVLPLHIDAESLPFFSAYYMYVHCIVGEFYMLVTLCILSALLAIEISAFANFLDNMPKV